MWDRKKSVNLSITVCFVLCGILAISLFAGPSFFEFYMTVYRGFASDGEAMEGLGKLFACCFYPSAVFSSIILYSLLRLLYNIKAERIFTDKNVKYLKTVSLCCFAIALITFIGGCFYIPFLFVAFAGGFVGMLLRVLKNVMQSAVELRCENDLTI